MKGEVMPFKGKELIHLKALLNRCLISVSGEIPESYEYGNDTDRKIRNIKLLCDTVFHEVLSKKITKVINLKLSIYKVYSGVSPVLR